MKLTVPLISLPSLVYILFAFLILSTSPMSSRISSNVCVVFKFRSTSY
uniref:Uncharacterized protein n=1 Tax=Lepeophtheirus salmonis TaxID=72036 RepID=A0A0K2TBG9_LEPSM